MSGRDWIDPRRRLASFFRELPRGVAIVGAALLSVSLSAVAQQENVLHSFGSGTDGTGPRGKLVFDGNGNLYGTTQSGGKMGDGTVFELAAIAGGGWTETTLYSFSGSDGSSPAAALIFDAAGNLYGTTANGGSQGGGTVFELSPPSTPGLPWNESVLYNFSSAQGSDPQGSLVFDASGNLYGTTTGGGAFGWGTVFELMPAVAGAWTQTVLHSFNKDGVDGYAPLSNLTLDAAGNLYGTTEYGAAGNDGVVFELSPNGDGTWTEALVHPFPSFKANGAYPFGAGLFLNSKYYITTSQGGAHGVGALVKITPATTLPWVCAVIHSFNSAGNSDGFEPEADVIADSTGRLYGTTYYGGANAGGTVYLVTQSAGVVTESLLYSFGAGGTDGLHPEAAMVFDSGGNLYGTTVGGGADGGGTVFQIVGSPSATVVASSLNSSTYGQAVTFTITVSSSSSATPTGKVVLKNGTTSLGTLNLTQGVASYTTATLTAGTKPITATYTGNGVFFAASTSPVLSQGVTTAASSVSLVSSSNPSTDGQAVTFTATVAAQYAGVPAGKVVFKDGTKTLSSVTLAGGQASFSTSTLGSGAHSIVASYAGNANFNPSSTTIMQTVN